MPTRDLRALVRDRRAEILEAAQRHGAFNVRIFGSVARGEAGSASDVDVLVEFEPGRSLLDHVALKQDLEDLLAARVDVVDARALHHAIRDEAVREAVPV